MGHTNRLRDMRARRGLSLRRLGAATGIDHSMLSRIERGQLGATDARKLVLAHYFGVPVTALFFIEDVSYPETPASCVDTKEVA